jgi:hypothetical protein
MQLRAVADAKGREMPHIEIGLLAFACIFGGAVLGLAVGRIIPESYTNEQPQKIVQSTMNTVALLSALVLGLLTASAKSNFDARNKSIEQFAANLIARSKTSTRRSRDSKISCANIWCKRSCSCGRRRMQKIVAWLGKTCAHSRASPRKSESLLRRAKHNAFYRLRAANCLRID